MRFDLIVRDGTLSDRTAADIAIKGDRIAAVAPGIEAAAGQATDAPARKPPEIFSPRPRPADMP